MLTSSTRTGPPPALAAHRAGALDADAIRRLLPHRAPFLLLDRVTELHPPERAVGIKCVSVAEPWFAGHFPDHMIFPGVLLGECLAQLAGVLLAAGEYNAQGPLGSASPGVGVLAAIRTLRFRRPVVPGDQVTLIVELTRRTAQAYEYHGTASVGPARAASGEIVLAFQPTGG